MLHHHFKLPLWRIVELLSTNPANLQPDRPRHARQGAHADVTIFDPKKKWTFDASQSLSKSRNTPFDGWNFIRARRNHDRRRKSRTRGLGEADARPPRSAPSEAASTTFSGRSLARPLTGSQVGCWDCRLSPTLLLSSLLPDELELLVFRRSSAPGNEPPLHSREQWFRFDSQTSNRVRLPWESCSPESNEAVALT